MKARLWKGTDVEEIKSRNISRSLERELWARTAGRCQFNGCNRPIFKSPLTQERLNVSERAHIYSFAENGPRGRGPYTNNEKQLNELSNLMLVCHDCHTSIDKGEQQRYPPERLLKWKEDHERRIEIVTGVHPNKKSQVILYGANIADQTSKLQAAAANEALFPDWYPLDERPTHLSMSWEGKDSDPDYWATEVQNLKSTFNRKIQPMLQEHGCPHLSLFALAPIPLMILFGSLLTDKPAAQTYQLHREPIQTWKWLEGPPDFEFQIKRPSSFEHAPALIISLSDHIATSRVSRVVGKNVSIWELTVERPHNDFLKSKEQLSKFRETVRELFVDIGRAHGKDIPISIFPAMPVACAVDLGRIRMPKASNQWMIYDQNDVRGTFIQALQIGGFDS